jgi:hypothetical protein
MPGPGAHSYSANGCKRPRAKTPAAICFPVVRRFWSYRPVLIESARVPATWLPCTERQSDNRKAAVRLRYKWATDGGRLTGDGANTSWVPFRPTTGRLSRDAGVDSGSDETCAAFSSAAVGSDRLSAAPPICPNVTISCPTDVRLTAEVVTVSANISGGSVCGTPAYNWTVSAGRIVEGQGTSTIR